MSAKDEHNQSVHDLAQSLMNEHMEVPQVPDKSEEVETAPASQDVAPEETETVETQEVEESQDESAKTKKIDFSIAQESKEETPDRISNLVKKFGELSIEDQQAKLEKLQTSGRYAELSALQESYDIEEIRSFEPHEEEEATSDIQKIIAKVEKMEKESRSRSELSQRNEKLIEFSNKNGLDYDQIKSDKNFVDTWHELSSTGMSLEKRLEIALRSVPNISNMVDSKNIQTKAEKLSRAKSASMGSSSKGGYTAQGKQDDASVWSDTKGGLKQKNEALAAKYIKDFMQ